MKSKQNERTALIIILLIGLALCALSQYALSEPAAPAPRRNTANDAPTVVYRVLAKPSTARASVTYENAGNNTEQHDLAKLPWELSFTASRQQFVYVSAQLDSGFEITCQIEVNGTVIEEATSSGRFVIASCSGVVP